jgi:hypothetical protein
MSIQERESNRRGDRRTYRQCVRQGELAGRHAAGPADILVAGMTAALLSGLPSISVTVARRGDVVASTRAIGSMVSADPGRQVPAGALLHVAISLGWAAVLSRVLPRRRPVVEGLLAGAVIAALDLAAIGRRIPQIRALPQGPQWADHLAYGVMVSTVLDRRARRTAARR